MGNVISIVGRRGSAGTSRKSHNPLGPGATVLIFTGVAVTVTGLAVAMGVNNWDEAIMLGLLISVVALIKIAIANFVFFAMLKADEVPDRRLAPAPTDPEPPAQRNPLPFVRKPRNARTRAQPRYAPQRVAAGGGGVRMAEISDGSSRDL